MMCCLRRGGVSGGVRHVARVRAPMRVVVDSPRRTDTRTCPHLSLLPPSSTPSPDLHLTRLLTRNLDACGCTWLEAVEAESRSRVSSPCSAHAHADSP